MSRTKVGPLPDRTSALKAILVQVNTQPEVQKNLKLQSALTVSALAADATETIESGTKVTVYSDTLPGTYFVRICADLGKVILEAVESNNCMDSNATDTTQTVTVRGAHVERGSSGGGGQRCGLLSIVLFGCRSRRQHFGQCYHRE